MQCASFSTRCVWRSVRSFPLPPLFPPTPYPTPSPPPSLLHTHQSPTMCMVIQTTIATHTYNTWQRKVYMYIHVYTLSSFPSVPFPCAPKLASVPGLPRLRVLLRANNCTGANHVFKRIRPAQLFSRNKRKRGRPGTEATPKRYRACGCTCVCVCPDAYCLCDWYSQ